MERRKINRYKPALMSLAILASFAISWLVYTNTLRLNFQNEIESSLEEVTGQEQIILEEEIGGKLELLTEVSRRIAFFRPDQYSEAVYTLKSTCMDNGFKRMGIIAANQVTYATDGAKMDLSDREFYIRGMKGESGISEPLIDRTDGKKINVYSVPVFYGGEITGVLFATYDTVEMRTRLAISSFHGQGYTYITAVDGECIVDSANENGYQGIDNVFAFMLALSEENRAVVNQMKRDLAAEKEGCVKFKNQGYRYMFYAPININDWYLLTVAPANVLERKMNAVLNKTYLLGVFLLVVCGAVVADVLVGQRKRKRELMDMIYIDRLTGGYSFERFQKEASALLKKAGEIEIYVISIDIDDFKFINELLGYEEGNRLLCYVYELIARTCSPGDIYAHQSADQFVVLTVSVGKEKLCAHLDLFCQTLLGYSSKLQNKLQIVPSAGIFHVTNPKYTLDYCLDCAGTARKSVKGQFDAYYAFYDDKVKQEIYRDKRIEAEMKAALKNGEFIVYYQPLYDAVTKTLVGAEALVRWERGDGIMVTPDQFVPLFEKNGFISELDQYMFLAVCKQQKKWLDMGYQPVPVSVNLSRKQLYDMDFIEEYRRDLEILDLPVGYMEVEITESVFFDNQPRVIEVMNILHQMGFKILLDDFGTGYSSMSMLKDMTFDTLKIDKSFVDSIGDERGNKIVNGIIRLAESLGLDTIAEGVETEQQYEYLREHGCKIIQGYYFGRPMPAGDFQKLL